GAGLENIDLLEAEKRGISCQRVPEGNARAVAEHALGMLLSLLNHLPRVHREIKEGKWLREPNKGRELQSLTVGVIGYGVMGSEFAQLLGAMGVKVLAYDKYKSGYAPDGVEEVSLVELQRRADVVSLHLPLTDETRGLADAQFFNGFAKPIHFINTARGPILKTNDLLAAMDEGKVLSAGLDVLEYEKSSFTSLFEDELPRTLQRLLQRENVLLSPHIAGWTKESFEKMGRGLAAKVLSQVRR
ncbi:MAG: NAD(P)-dependent oxidoreductase, partial [Flavobacteriales bacterium]